MGLDLVSGKMVKTQTRPKKYLQLKLTSEKPWAYLVHIRMMPPALASLKPDQWTTRFGIS